MKQLILNIKDDSKLSFLLQLIRQFEFVEVKEVKKNQRSENHNFFNSAGLWSNRSIDANKLRDKAWNRQK